MFNLSNKDFVQNAEFVGEEEIRYFNLGIMKNGKVKRISDRVKSYDYIVKTSTYHKLLIFLSDGNVILIPAYMLQNIGDKSINIIELIESTSIKIKF